MPTNPTEMRALAERLDTYLQRGEGTVGGFKVRGFIATMPGSDCEAAAQALRDAADREERQAEAIKPWKSAAMTFNIEAAKKLVEAVRAMLAETPGCEQYEPESGIGVCATAPVDTVRHWCASCVASGLADALSAALEEVEEAEAREADQDLMLFFSRKDRDILRWLHAEKEAALRFLSTHDNCGAKAGQSCTDWFHEYARRALGDNPGGE